MALNIPALLRNGIATARTITLSAHVTVTHRAWIGQTFDGTPTFVDKQYKALVERKQTLVKTMTGTEDTSNTYIAILEQIAPTVANPGYVRTNPVDVNDHFVIPDGTEVTVMAVDGFFDGETGVPFYSQVYA